ncbi:hypothetical protein [Parapedobacter indicus]|nr:hypothetical protein [Parapedobacter indicus]
MKNINACRQRFMVEAVTLFLSIKGRINFQQLERYGKYSERRYRIQFEKPFDFMLSTADWSGSTAAGITSSPLTPASSPNRAGRRPASAISGRDRQRA